MFDVCRIETEQQRQLVAPPPPSILNDFQVSTLIL